MNVCGYFGECTADADLDGVACHVADQVSATASQVRLVAVEPGGPVTATIVCVPGSVALDRRSLSTAASDAVLQQLQLGQIPISIDDGAVNYFPDRYPGDQQTSGQAIRPGRNTGRTGPSSNIHTPRSRDTKRTLRRHAREARFLCSNTKGAGGARSARGNSPSCGTERIRAYRVPRSSSFDDARPILF